MGQTRKYQLLGVAAFAFGVVTVAALLGVSSSVVELAYRLIALIGIVVLLSDLRFKKAPAGSDAGRQQQGRVISPPEPSLAVFLRLTGFFVAGILIIFAARTFL